MLTAVLVEDEDLVRRELALFTPWEKHGWNLVQAAADGLEGVEAVMRLRPDLVITDIRMPGLDGLALIREVQGSLDPSEWPQFVLVSGHADFEFARRALQLGVKDYLLKPVDDAELAGLLDKMGETLRTAKEAEAAPAQGAFERFLSRPDAVTGEKFVREAVAFLEGRYRTSVTLEETAARLSVSPGYLNRLFRRDLGLSFHEWLTCFRVRRAMELLKRPEVKVYEVADQVGYGDPRHFGQTFRKLLGVTPSQYKARS